MTKSLRDLTALTAVAIVATQSHVHGYIDPGSTSMLLQGIIGGVAAVLVITRSYWARVVRRARRTVRSPGGPTPAAKDAGEAQPSNPEA